MWTKILQPIIMPDKDTQEYFKDNLPNFLAIYKTQQVLSILEKKNIEPDAVRCSGIGGSAIIFSKDNNYSHIECSNSGEIDFLNIERILNHDTISEIKDLEKIRCYPAAEQDDDHVNFIESWGWWDGPLSGIVKYQDKEYYADLIHQTNFRVYAIYDLPTDSLKDQSKEEEILKNSVKIGYFDNNEYRFRKTLHRHYFVHNESREEIHGDHCMRYDDVKWRNDAWKFHEEKEESLHLHNVLGGVYEGWAISIYGKKEHTWTAIYCCPWCGVQLPKKFNPELYKEEK